MTNTNITRLAVILMTVISTIIFSACQRDTPKDETKARAPGPRIETPCVGTLVLRHAYSECQSDGFWHTVEDNYIICREDNKERKFRVSDTKTTQVCQPISPRPPVTGNGYTAHSSIPAYSDSTCYEDGTITISECEFGIWIEKKYTLIICDDRRLKIIKPTGDSAIATLVPCDQPVPRPAK